MKLLKQSIALLMGLALFLFACKKDEKQQSPSENILINQIGYEVGTEKIALLRLSIDQFQIRTLVGEVVFEGNAGPLKYWELSGDSVRKADFSAFDKSGIYVLWAGNEHSHPFQIAEDLFGLLADAALKSYYFTRCGVDLDPIYAGKWHRKAGHPDTTVLIHISAADGFRPKGTVLSSPGGWYDAGDYGKYIVNSGISTYTLLLSSELNAAYHNSQDLHIPESDNELPDIFDEALVNLKWMLTMQDPNDGGVYHKLTTKNFVDFVMPTETNEPRFVVQKSTAGTLDFAATMAHSSRLCQNYGLKALAMEMKNAAEKAWIWSLRNPDVLYHQPEDISTGAYDDRSIKDEWYWAAVEMYLLDPRNRSYLDQMLDHYEKPGTPSWNQVNTLGVISLLSSEHREKFAEQQSDLLAHVDSLLKLQAGSPYHVSIGHFEWGSNSEVANEGMLKMIAFRLTGDKKYLASARNDLDYILGRNATSYSFVTGFGSKTPMHPHHRIMSADGVDDPFPGFLVGGPNTVVMDDCDPQPIERSKFPASSYIDEECSYSTNETAINWNAPLVFLISAIEAGDK